MYSRHDLVWLTPDGWAAVAGRAAQNESGAIARWAREDWPAIVRRHDPAAGPDCISLGIPLPPDPATGHKPRVALHALRSHISRHTRPMSLAQASTAAPPAWRTGLAQLATDFDPCCLRAYGSLALQAVTGLAYLRPSSDIDLLFEPSTPSQLTAGIDLLSACAQRLPLDGEIMFPSAEAVAWREWRDARAGARVMAKSIGAVRLADPAALLATLETP